MQIGQRFGRLTVLKRVGDGKGSNSKWLCHCDCGNEIITFAGNMRRGKTRSCGCLYREARGLATVTHGETRGYKRTVEWQTWAGMFKRCYNPKNKSFRYYGGKGIKVCERWRDYAQFLTDMGRKPSPEHSIDRIDNDDDYTSQNCRWATRREQRMNQTPRKAA
jgi:hypothetical protein